METNEEPHAGLDKGQRIGVALLICITLLLIGISFLQYDSSIRSYGKRKDVKGVATVDPNKKGKQQQDALKKIDTDKDGLSDYDEIYIYHSSPYIRDTDSDGTADGDEVRRGTSPVCPEGKDCSIDSVVAADQAGNPAAAATAAAAVTTGQPAAQVPATAIVPAATGTATAPAAAPTALPDFSKLDPKEIRKLLVEQGAPQEKVAALSDAELIDLMKEAVAETAKNQNALQAGGSGAPVAAPTAKPPTN